MKSRVSKNAEKGAGVLACSLLHCARGHFHLCLYMLGYVMLGYSECMCYYVHLEMFREYTASSMSCILVRFQDLFGTDFQVMLTCISAKFGVENYSKETYGI